MRPDQHKQKKNSQYKRKHGIASKKETVDDNSETKRSGTSSGRQKSEVCSAKGKGDLKPHPNQDLNDSDDDVKVETEPCYERKTFRRREIVSNWNQYTLPDESEKEALSKGEDFNSVLNTAGGSHAQFRFKDEQDWESDVPSFTETSNILCLDCDLLATAMKCIPLHNRLQLEEDLFSKEQLDLFVEDANKHEHVYKEFVSINGGHDITETLNSLKLKNSESKENDMTSVSQNKHVLSSDASSRENIVLTISHKKDAGHKEVIKVICSKTDIKPPCKNKENVLVDKTGAEENQSYKSLEKLKPKIPTTNDDDDVLDFLLSMETPQSKTALVSTANNKSETPQSKTALVSTPSNKSETPQSKTALVSTPSNKSETPQSKTALVSTPSNKSETPQSKTALVSTPSNKSETPQSKTALVSTPSNKSETPQSKTALVSTPSNKSETPQSKTALVSTPSNKSETPQSKTALVSTPSNKSETPQSKTALVSTPSNKSETPQSKTALVSTPSNKSVECVKEKQLELETKPVELSSDQATKSIKSDEKSSLEDWLDCMLDD